MLQVATTRKGVRLYFTCLPPTPQSAYMSASAGMPPPLLPDPVGLLHFSLDLEFLKMFSFRLYVSVLHII